MTDTKANGETIGETGVTGVNPINPVITSDSKGDIVIKSEGVIPKSKGKGSKEIKPGSKDTKAMDSTNGTNNTNGVAIL